jgi:hypothetical protein
MAFVAKLGDETYTVEIEEVGKSLYRISVNGNEFLADSKKTGRNSYSLIVDNRSFEIDVDNTEDEYRVLVDGEFGLSALPENFARFAKGELIKPVLALD